MVSPRILQNYIACPLCSRSVVVHPKKIVCENCHKTFSYANGIVDMIVSNDYDDTTEETWDQLYVTLQKSGDYKKHFKEYKKNHSSMLRAQLQKVQPKRKTAYLEIGSGMFFLGQELAKQYDVVIGVDYSRAALNLSKKMLDEKGIRNYILIRGNVMALPIQNSIIDFIYGGGVIEHFENTQKCVNELFRVLNVDGVSFNTVPFLNVGSLTYRQVWGNIPNVPFVRDAAKFFHVNILGGKHMIFGHEYSFLSSTLRSLHARAGFEHITIDKFQVQLAFEFIPPFVRPYAKQLAENSPLFWPMVKIIAIK